MRIVINALSIRSGGGLTVVLGLAESLRQQSDACEITVLASTPRVIEAFNDLGVVDRLETIMPGAGSMKLFAWQNTMLGPWIRKHGGDRLITINHFLHNVRVPQTVYHVNLLRFMDLPNSGRKGFGDRIRDRAARLAMRHADANIFESQYLRTTAEENLGFASHNGHVVYIGLPNDLLAISKGLQNREASPAPSRRIVSISNPIPHKDNTTLIRLVHTLANRDATADCRLDIVGGVNNDAWKPYQQLARELGVFDRIRWHGYCSMPQIGELLADSLCLVSTSLVESFSMVGLEAMAHGCPPIVCNCSSMPESVGESGLLAEAGSAESFADRVEELIVDPGYRARLVELGHFRCRQFSWTDCGHKFWNILKMQGDSPDLLLPPAEAA